MTLIIASRVSVVNKEVIMNRFIFRYSALPVLLALVGFMHILDSLATLLEDLFDATMVEEEWNRLDEGLNDNIFYLNLGPDKAA